ncbi:MAG: glycosyltransferase [Chloroflexi bacterium]|nr:glycosyltransferase [Chloroflexota bacterium]
MTQNSKTNTSPYLVWVIPDDIFNSFSATPRLEIAKEMRNLGWKVDLIAAGANGRQMVQDVEVLCFPQPNVYLIRQVIYHWYVVRHVLRNWRQIDALLFHQVSLPWFLLLRFFSRYQRTSPTFVMDTRTVPMEPVEKATFKDRIRGEFYFVMNNLANRLIDGQTAITQRMAELLDIPSEKLWGTWPSGVNLDQFSVSIGNRQWGGPGDPVNIIYIGSLHYERNLTTLCKAVVSANEAGMKFKLLLYGEGTEKKDLQAFASEHPEEVAVFDGVSHGEVPAVLASAHVGVLPFPDEDKYKVCSPIKLFEYMGSGLPLLATEIVCHTDVVGNGEYVFWAKNAEVDGIFDSLKKVWDARLSLPAMSGEALKAANNWTYKSSAKRLNDALRYGLSISKNGKTPKVNDQ